MTNTGEQIRMEKILAFFSLSYTGVTAYIIQVEQVAVYAQVFMYLSAGILSLVTAFYVWKNKGKGKK